MAHKRRREFRDVDDSDSDDIAILDPIEDSISDQEDFMVHSSQDMPIDSDHSSSSDADGIDRDLYKEVLKDYHDIKEIKRNLKMKLNHGRKKSESLKKSKYAFTHFSVNAFNSVVTALTPEKKNVIEDYGFGSLLHFDKCFVPNKFAKWIARQVDYKSGDVIVDGKIITLSKESVHLVLGLPLGGTPFPTDFSISKSVILQKFNKQSVPSVTYLAKKLENELQTFFDEDLLVCFLLVALGISCAQILLCLLVRNIWVYFKISRM